MNNLTSQQKGSLLAFVAVMFITPDSLFIRLSNVDTWGLVFYRGIIPFFTVLFGMLILYRFKFFMFTRIHVLKFQNKVAKDSLKNTCRLINDKLLKRGLYSSTFVDVNDTNLYVINTWKDEKTSDKAHSQYTDFVKQVKEMGVNVVIVGGDTEVIYSDPSILQKYTKVE